MLSHERMDNRMLGCLSEREYEFLAPHLERVTLPHNKLIAEPGTPIDHAYFPAGCVLSSVVVLDDGSCVEAVTAGNEGMVYVGLFADHATSPFRIVSQISGDCFRIPVAELRRSLDVVPRLRTILERYCLVLLLQSSQNSACNLRHTIDKRLARWLLVSADRANRDDLDLTQESLSVLLGVRRQSVNVSIGELQRAGLIRYRRGGLTIADRAGLTAIACECYRTIANTYNSVMEMECADGVRVV